MVESAFIFTVFFFLMIGIFDFGQFLFVHQALVERARYATRWGAATGATTAQIKNMVLYNQATTPSPANGYFNLADSNVTVTASTDTVCPVSGAGASLYKLVTVQLQNYNYRVISPYIGGTYTGPAITVTEPIYQDFSTVSICP